jgi:NTP pyrophosphatase (non-canonical NTP hydrolase)
MTEEQYNAITTWQKNTFKQATPLSKIAHLRQEIEELAIDIKNNNPNQNLEFADCFILLFGAANSAGMSYQNIIDAINQKMEINYQRKWGKPNEDGVVNHLKK